MAREYVTKAGKAIDANNRPEADKLAVAFRKKVLGYLGGTIRSAEGVANLKQGLKKYTSSPETFLDFAKMFTVLRDSEALAAFGTALPAKIKKLDDQVFAKVLQQLNAFKAKHADAVPFALTMIARRLETPWQLIYLATKTVESKAAAAIAATPYAIVVSMALDQIDEKQLLLRVALRNNRIVIAKGILREIYAIEEAIKSNVELGNSDWGTRLRDTMAAVAAALEAEVDIRPTQYSVMTVIGANPGSTQMAVAKRLGIERARLVHLLNSLERRKLVKRVASATDRRSHALHLTAQGEAQLARFKRLAAEHERHVAAKIGKENRERLLQILSSFT